MEEYGTDRPDLRFDLKHYRIDEIANASSFTILKDVLEDGGIVKAMKVPNGASTISRREIDRYAEFVSQFGLKGLAWMKYQEGAFTSNIVKFFSEHNLEMLQEKMNIQEGDLILIAASDASVVHQSLDHLRRHIARQLNLIDEDKLCFLWVTDFPLLEWDHDERRYTSTHHPFTSPIEEDIPLLDTEPLKVRSNAYDVVLNGYEIGGGSQRIHDTQLQKKMFSLLNLTDEEIETKFGFFAEALQYGTPPHLGIALGLDRLVMLLVGTENIRDVIAFPKTQKASDVMMNCPSAVASEQLEELSIAIEEKR